FKKKIIEFSDFGGQMRKLILLLSFLINFTVLGQAPTAAWINEFHYENIGTDANEFVEVTVNESFSDLANLELYLYNGGDSFTYGNIYDLTEFTAGDTIDGFIIYSVLISGIQNGPDGFALSYGGNLITGQFLTYEGTITALNGPANGITSTDVGVEESSTTSGTSSLGLTGTGTQYSDFTWTTFLVATPGQQNLTQALPVELTSFSVSNLGDGIKLKWTTATEVNNYGFDIERKTYKQKWQKIGFVNGSGNSYSNKAYSFLDKTNTTQKYQYRLKQIDFSGNFEYSKIIEVDFPSSPKDYELSQNYPNPFNPSTTIKFSLPEDGNVKLIIYNLLGQKIKTLIDGFTEAGIHTINFNGEGLQSGLYFYKIETQGFNQVKKMTLIK
ncbi:MAG: T9SS type A sorting domain-containing protein, partial [Ignavibacteriaceae bacterium]